MHGWMPCDSKKWRVRVRNEGSPSVLHAGTHVRMSTRVDVPERERAIFAPPSEEAPIWRKAELDMRRRAQGPRHDSNGGECRGIIKTAYVVLSQDDKLASATRPNLDGGDGDAPQDARFELSEKCV